MSVPVATRPAKPPLGGRSGAWGHRIVRFHIPLALVSAAVLVLFMGLPTFTDGGSHADITSGALPQARENGTGAMPMNHGDGEDVSGAAGGGDHGGGEAGGMDMEAAGQGAGLVLRFTEPGSRAFVSQLTVATGYVATVFLALTLLIGPANLLLRKRNPVSSYLRRDVGTWTAIFSVVHVILAFQMEFSGQISDFFNYFVAGDGTLLTNSFGWGNWTGLAATVIVIALLVTSTDRSMRELKAKPWKNLQRLNYALFALVIAHAFFYGALVQLTSPFALLLTSTVAVVLVGQAIGIRLWRRRYAAQSATPRHTQTAGLTR